MGTSGVKWWGSRFIPRNNPKQKDITILKVTPEMFQADRHALFDVRRGSCQAKKLDKPLIASRKICRPQAKKTMKPTLSPLALDKSHHARLGQYAANLWKDKVLTDVIIIVQNHEFKTHKAVLACYSPYFADAFVRPGFSDVHYVSFITFI
ncbi:BTB domain-containing protein [Trichonephila inaurata madagascariensis]|uniref:BTB domain-containing protein n=1 Tax=Trichonephila inaurata madagascariensis TaxID=2747483 RepID=A0A8X6YFZ4_9ARAC|nr:BTB domain-containing protein [Trichonephila inaurata madagascariensis]